MQRAKTLVFVLQWIYCRERMFEDSGTIDSRSHTILVASSEYMAMNWAALFYTEAWRFLTRRLGACSCCDRRLADGPLRGGNGCDCSGLLGWLLEEERVRWSCCGCCSPRRCRSLDGRLLLGGGACCSDDGGLGLLWLDDDKGRWSWDEEDRFEVEQRLFVEGRCFAVEEQGRLLFRAARDCCW
jgi:hypothetical protein